MRSLRPAINRPHGLSKKERIPLALFAFAALIPWALLAHSLLVNGDELNPSWDDTTCYSGNATWAYSQGAIALAGLALAGIGLALYLRRPDDRPTIGRAPLRLAGLLLFTWLVLVFPLDPRDSLGVYGGCGLG